MLIVALVAVVGFAAFSTSSGGSDDPVLTEVDTASEASTAAASARVASAVLALRVTDTAPTALVAPATTESSSTSSSTSSSIADTTTTEDSTTSSSTSPPASSTSSEPTTTTEPPDTTPPSITITSPNDGDEVDDRVVTFAGTAEAGADVYSGPYSADVDEDGNWTIRLVVSSNSVTTARITAEDAAGNTATASIQVTYSAPAPPPPSPTTTQGSTPTTTSAGPKWSPLWPADPGGKHNVEYWRPLVSSIWPDHLVNCALNIIYYESRGDARAYNGNGAGFEGLFQHHSGYWKGRAAAAGYRDSNGLYATPYNAEANVAVSWYLARNSDPWDRHWSVNPRNGPLECNE